MAFEEKRAWIMIVTTVIVYSTYVSIILGRAGDTPLPDVPYAATMLWSIGIAIASQIVAHIVAGIFSPQDHDKKDQRDREIDRFGEHIGQSFLIIGAVSAMAMAMAKWNPFWIANVIYLGFVLQAILSSVAKIFAYRKGFHPW